MPSSTTSTMANDSNSNNNSNNNFVVRVTARFVVLSLVSCMLLAFAIGRVAKMTLLKHETDVL
eukprot:CAMPEP_0113470884 /NCGR_PEP_ID=MMETSP0014_2-20120614/16686_1 /TAXON_ID=2857 /ORGANISM="Nitzschia sp." /LENGTH=62 /DNA_ID=CAMNT_0000363489 /DNA_START=456 /DNA_END=641 /DNA_ORIENTATION=+ /assembly_acc=CAM_ASM_000159